MIMFADMVGYRALAQHNEKLAQELLEKRRWRVRNLLSKQFGREVQKTGARLFVIAQ